MSSLETFRKRIHSRMRRLVTLVDDNYPPDLTGQDATDFTTDANGLKDDCDDILQDTFFSGITPVVQSPTGGSLIDYCESIEQDAYDILGLPSPTTAQKQEAADYYATLADQADDLIDDYT